MFEFFNSARKRRLSFESGASQAPQRIGLVQLQTMQMVAQQVVLSLEGSVRLPGASKKAVALKIVGELLEQLEIVAPDSLKAQRYRFGIDTAIEPAVRMLKVLDPQAAPEQPGPSGPAPEPQELPRPDVSGRPQSGNNSEKGLSL